MPIEIVAGDLMQVPSDALVVPTDSMLSHSASIDREVYLKYRERLDQQICDKVFLCPGQVLFTPKMNADEPAILFACGPVFVPGQDQSELLSSCYREAMELAADHQLTSIAFPLISSGNFGYPIDRAFHIAYRTLCESLLRLDMEVKLVLYDGENRQIANHIRETVFDSEVDFLPNPKRPSLHVNNVFGRRKQSVMPEMCCSEGLPMGFPVQESFEKIALSESFTDCLIRLIDEKDMSDPQVYTQANIDRRAFNKIINGHVKTPKKETVLALAIGLKASLEECTEMLYKAGYALSDSILMDRIVKSFIERGHYDLSDINETLFDCGLRQLGVAA